MAQLSPQSLGDLYRCSFSGILAWEVSMTWEHAGSSKCFDFSVSKRVNASVYQTKGQEMVLAGV